MRNEAGHGPARNGPTAGGLAAPSPGAFGAESGTIGGAGASGGGRPRPVPQPKLPLCPYCGHVTGNTRQCECCKGLLDPLSKQASQNAMGPWFVRDVANPYKPGCSYETVRQLVLRGRIGPETIVRGPSTRQFWMHARHVPGVAHLLGRCHNCQSPTTGAAAKCASCGASFEVSTDRQQLGLGGVHLLPGHAAPEVIASQAFATGVSAPVVRRKDAPMAGGTPTTPMSPPAWTTPGGARPVAGPIGVGMTGPAGLAGAAVGVVGPGLNAGGGAEGEPIGVAAMHRMQRRLARQRRTTVVLVLLLLGAIAALVVGVVGPEVQRRGGLGEVIRGYISAIGAGEFEAEEMGVPIGPKPTVPTADGGAAAAEQRAQGEAATDREGADESAKEGEPAAEVGEDELAGLRARVTSPDLAVVEGAIGELRLLAAAAEAGSARAEEAGVLLAFALKRAEELRLRDE